MMETYRGVVHPWLCDIMGHLTTRHYVAMFDDASYHLSHACGIHVDPIDPVEGFVDVKLELDFIKEMKAGSLLMVQSGILRLGTKSFTAIHEMLNLEDMSLAARLTSVSVAFDLKARKAIPLSDDFRRKAAIYLVAGDGSAG